MVNLVYTQPTKAVRDLLEEAVQICIVGQHKYRSLHLVLHGLVNMLEQSNGRTQGVQRATGPPSSVQLLYTESTGTVRDRFEGVVQIHTAGVRKCRSLHTVCHGLMNMFERSNAHTPGVQGATGLPSLVQLLYTHATGTVKDRFVVGVQRRSANVRKCR